MVSKSFLFVAFLAAIAGAAPTQVKRTEAADLFKPEYNDETATVKRTEAAELFKPEYNDETTTVKRAEAAELFKPEYNDEMATKSADVAKVYIPLHNIYGQDSV